MPTSPKPIDYLGLTKEQFDQFYDACHQTLGSVFSDAFAEEPVVRRSAVIDIVIDQLSCTGGRMGCGGGGKRAEEWSALYKTVIDPWISLHFGKPKFVRLMKEVFPYKTYSL